ncbi:MAG: bifunctional 5,10-methylenetetrahydrofolate dehydrogenase/5,10-methenyltetrahydrofolate cyclohydrolase [bacterium]|nr:bifunctional 5,10-methylenetetrahydrofolate dehydrogenase/5,10-methenyltetrahydrofolate cyclohydrolase [bacterium]
MAIILSGHALAEDIFKNVKKKASVRKLCLAIVQVGENAVSARYVRSKIEAATSLGINVSLVSLLASVSTKKAREAVRKLAQDKNVQGIIVQLPLPKAVQAQEVLDEIPLEKDVDVLSSLAFGKFALGVLSILPPTVGAIANILRKAGVNLKGAEVALIGAGRLVGLPLMLWLVRQGATVHVMQKSAKDISAITKKADVVISGTGASGILTGKMIKKGAVVIDAGTSEEAGSYGGDVDFKSVEKIASVITPVPGGVGPMTVACLLENLVTLASI